MIGNSIVLVDGRAAKIISVDNDTKAVTVMTDRENNQITLPVDAKITKHGSEYYQLPSE